VQIQASFFVCEAGKGGGKCILQKKLLVVKKKFAILERKC
jgi:hypothetical protein